MTLCASWSLREWNKWSWTRPDWTTVWNMRTYPRPVSAKYCLWVHQMVTGTLLSAYFQEDFRQLDNLNVRCIGGWVQILSRAHMAWSVTLRGNFIMEMHDSSHGMILWYHPIDFPTKILPEGTQVDWAFASLEIRSLDTGTTAVLWETAIRLARYCLLRNKSPYGTPVFRFFFRVVSSRRPKVTLPLHLFFMDIKTAWLHDGTEVICKHDRKDWIGERL